ncbi:MAG: MFS transporter, partial [Candidatus Limnocylindrales bacterium]
MSGSPPLLALREFRALLGARSTNALAVSALATVVAFQTYDLTRDPLSLGWLGLVEAIPALSLVLFGGHLADRRDRRAIVLVASAIVTASALALAILSASGGAPLLGILAVIFATGIASGFERPALTALEAQVVPREEAARGISILNSVSQGGAILGPAVGGIAIAVVGIATTYVGIAI